MDFLDSNNATDIVTFLTDKGVTSQADVVDQAGNYFEPSTSNSEYLFNENGIIQIGSIVIRGVNDEGYFLAVQADELDSTTYNQLTNKVFDESRMCKLIIGGDYGTNLDSYISNHIGEDNTSTSPNPPVANCRKVVRWYASGTGVYVCDESWYFLGIRYKHRVTLYEMK